MRVLILSCNTGGGHNACADAIHEAFVEQGHYCNIADALDFVSEKLSKFVAWGHTAMYRHVPGLMRVGYDFAEKHPQLLQDDTAVYKLLTGGTEQLHEYIRAENYDTVICVHIFAGLLLGQMQKEHPTPLKTALVATDYTCSPGTANSGLGCYFIPAASLTEEFQDQGVPADRIVPSGIPVRRDFYEQADKPKAKQALGIVPGHTHLLMMCGSMGCGPLDKLAGMLSQGMDDTMELSIVCGTNEKLFEELSTKFKDMDNVHIFGFVKDMAAMMDSADLCLTKPGGLSSTEAAAKRLPMVFVDTVAGCEEYNLQFFVTMGGAVTADTPEALVQMCLELMRSENRRMQMASALDTLPRQNAAQCICRTMCANG